MNRNTSKKVHRLSSLLWQNNFSVQKPVSLYLKRYDERLWIMFVFTGIFYSPCPSKYVFWNMAIIPLNCLFLYSTLNDVGKAAELFFYLFQLQFLSK